jgi:di/tricarboxylate transporter
LTLEMWIALGILGAAIFLFVTEFLRVDVVALGVMVALMLTGLLSPQEAISGFANPAVLTIFSLFIIGGGLMQTGVAGTIGRRILQIGGGSQTRLMIVIMLAVAGLSAFMSSTGTVAVLLPAILSLALSANISPSKLLIPLAYASLLGGALTLIGTPPNILASDMLREAGFTPFNFFDYTPVGLLLLAAGTVFMLLVGQRLLPDYKPKSEVQRVETPEELVTLYRLPDNLYRLRVRRGSPLIGKSVIDSRLRQDFSVSVLEIVRSTAPRPLARLGDNALVLQSDTSEHLRPEAEVPIAQGDVLIVQGKATDIGHVSASLNLGVQPVQEEGSYSPITQEVGVAEILLPPRSSLVGKTVVEARFGSLYHLTVLGIQRPGVEGSLDLKTTPLRFGDTLLVQGAWDNILALRQFRRDFVVMGQPETMIGAPARSKAPLALLVMVGMLVLMVTEILPLTTASMLAALVMVLTGCVTMDEAYESVDWKSIVLIAGMLPMSIALERVGLVNLVAQGMIETLGSLGPLLVLGSLFLLTSLFTQVLSNTATTVLIAPIGLAAAQKLGVDPHAFLMGVAIAASMAFASPVASPVNTLVMGAGSYRFSDYMKVGVPMIIITLIAAMIGLPLIFPF